MLWLVPWGRALKAARPMSAKTRKEAGCHLSARPNRPRGPADWPQMVRWKKYYVDKNNFDLYDDSAGMTGLISRFCAPITLTSPKLPCSTFTLD